MIEHGLSHIVVWANAKSYPQQYLSIEVGGIVYYVGNTNMANEDIRINASLQSLVVKRTLRESMDDEQSWIVDSLVEGSLGSYDLEMNVHSMGKWRSAISSQFHDVTDELGFADVEKKMGKVL